MSKNTYRIAIAIILLLTAVLATATAVTRAQQDPPMEQTTVGSEVQGVLDAQADVALRIGYQGRLADPTTGQAQPDGNYGMTFRLYAVASGGSALWTESKSVVVSSGVFSTELGDTTALNANLFNGQALWLGIQVNPDPETSPRQRITVVPYAASLVPGAQISGNSPSQILYVVNANGIGIYGKSTNSYGGFFTSDADHFDLALGGPVGRINTDPNDQNSNMILASNNDVNIRLDNDGGENGVFRIQNSGGAAVVSVDESGNTQISGSLTANGVPHPIAFGFIYFDGTKGSGTANVSSLWSAVNQRYEITISGESYVWDSYSTQVTLAGSCGFGYMTRTNSVSGKLIVEVFDRSGNRTQCAFQFITHKP